MTSCKDLDYKKACEERDFVKAYHIVDILKEKVHSEETSFWYGQHEKWQAGRVAQKKAHDAEIYVVRQEALMLLENGDDSSLMRIVAVAKEHDADSWLYDELIDVATKIGNNDLADRLRKMKNSIEY